MPIYRHALACLPSIESHFSCSVKRTIAACDFLEVASCLPHGVGYMSEAEHTDADDTGESVQCSIARGDGMIHP